MSLLLESRLIFTTNTREHRQALKHHPDRVPADSPERAQRTRRFQQINDAYYTLSDPVRRRDYDSARSFHSSSSSTYDAPGSEPEDYDIPGTTADGTFPSWSSFFNFGNTGTRAQTENERDEFSNQQFGNAFEEMLREEGMAEGEQARPTGKFWSIVGGLSGGAMGFIVANFPGAVAGAVAGNRLGAVRDSRGKSVYAVFQVSQQCFLERTRQCRRANALNPGASSNGEGQASGPIGDKDICVCGYLVIPGGRIWSWCVFPTTSSALDILIGFGLPSRGLEIQH